MLTTVHLAEQPSGNGTMLMHDIYGHIATVYREEGHDQWRLDWTNDNLGWESLVGQSELALKIMAYAYCVELSACGY